MEILIADDSAVSRRLLEAVLSRWGYQVISASSGTEAWKLLQSDNSPKIAILDWMMPGLTGPEVCRRVRLLNRGFYTYLILLTSRSEKEDLIQGMEAGADDYLVKPVDNNELKVRLGPGKRIVDLQVELMKAQEALREQATRDSVTKLWNRHAIFDILGRELTRARRESRPLGVVMGDVDRFKSINDTYGHVAGDTVLQEVAARMAQSVRAYDAVGRYGGEEFLLLLPGCDGPTTLQRAERLRLSVRREPVIIQGVEIEVTISFGVTAMPKEAVADSEQLVRLADAALYEAKENGRDRCEYIEFR
jgi:diguanylate cyclase (GGDEF)-like protein